MTEKDQNNQLKQWPLESKHLNRWFLLNFCCFFKKNCFNVYYSFIIIIIILRTYVQYFRHII